MIVINVRNMEEVVCFCCEVKLKRKVSLFERERTVIKGTWNENEVVCLFVLCCTIDYFDCVVVVEWKMNVEEMKLIHA